MGISTEEVLRGQYAAYAAMDIAAIDAAMQEDAVMHISGHHPLSGEYRGKAAAWGYLGKVAEVSGGKGGFVVHSITTATGLRFSLAPSATTCARSSTSGTSTTDASWSSGTLTWTRQPRTPSGPRPSGGRCRSQAHPRARQPALPGAKYPGIPSRDTTVRSRL